MPLLYPQLSSRGLRWLVMPVDKLMQSERDLVRMRRTPGDNALQLNRIVSDGTYFHQLGFNDFGISHRKSRMAQSVEDRYIRSDDAPGVTPAGQRSLSLSRILGLIYTGAGRAPRFR